MSLNIVNKTTGSITQVAGNVDDSGIGNLDALHTENKSSLVSAINEVGTTFKGTQYDWNQLTLAQKTSFDRAIITDDYAPLSIGNLSSLTTTDKSSVVGAINEVNSKNASQISYNNSTSGMTASNVQGAVDELNSGLTNVSDFVNTVIAHTEFLIYRGNMGSDPYTSTDFNNYRYDGIYSNGDTSNFTNAPTSNPDNGYLIAFSGNSTVQIWIGKYLGSLRARTYSNGTWSSWSNLINA